LAGFAAKLAPSEDAFFWRFYAPMMSELLAALPDPGRVLGSGGHDAR
jgi:hypothetical protein